MYETRKDTSPMSAIFAASFLFASIWWMLHSVG